MIKLPEGPFMCAGVTVFNALRKSGACAVDVDALQCIGGLGYLGVQYTRRMGFQNARQIQAMRDVVRERAAGAAQKSAQRLFSLSDRKKN